MAKQEAKAAVPRLRFPEFARTGPWKPRRLEEIAPLQRGFDLPSDQIEPGRVPVVYSNGIQSFHRIGMAKAPGLITGRSGTIGKLHFVESGDYWPHNTSLWVTSFKGNVPKFIYFLYESIGMARFASGSGVPTLNRNDVHAFQALLPETIVEQQKVADCLTSLDELIAAQDRKVEALKTHKRGLMRQLFPREGETCPRLRFPEYRDAPDWTLGKAGDIVDVLQGYGFPERLQGSREGEFPFYKVSDISACVDAGGILLDEANNHIGADVLEELRAKLMPVGSTVFAKIGEAIRSNKRAITSRPCLVDNNAAGVKAIAGLAHDRFVYYLWCQVPLIEYAGGVVPAVNKSAMEQIPVCYPKPDEQQHIADCLSSLDSHIEAESNQLTALKTYKQGLMQQLFPALIEG